MRRLSLMTMAMLMVFAFSACKNNKKKGGEKQMAPKTESSKRGKKMLNIELTKLTDSPKYEDASLKMKEPSKMHVKKNKVHFVFDLENMQLGVQTANAGENGLASSKMGQHLHLLIDGQPYTAHYKAEFTQKISNGQHVILAFPSRSYHESVKNPNAYVLSILNVGDSSKKNSDLKMKLKNKPLLFYSRPKGTYSGEDAQKVLLDFYLVNVDLSPNGYHVRAIIDGEKFILDDWTGYAMEGLPMGKNTIKLELIGPDGKLVKSPFNSVKRSFTLKK